MFENEWNPMQWKSVGDSMGWFPMGNLGMIHKPGFQ